MKTLIIDDEPLAREGMSDYVKQVDFLELAGTATDALDALSFLQTNKVDLLLLDINMPRLSGIDFLKTLDNPPIVILTTAYPSFALEAYQLNVLDYLMKPITFPRFLNSVMKAKKQFDLLQKVPVAPSEANSNRHFFVKCEGKAEKISLSELLYVEGMQNYIHIYTERGKFTALLTLKSIESQLPEPQFFRIHKSYIANLEKVSTIDGNMLEIGAFKIPVSRTKIGKVSDLILGGNLLS